MKVRLMNNGIMQKELIYDFSNLSRVEFEDILLEIFSLLGYTVQKTRMLGDQSADFILYKNDLEILLQANRCEGSVTDRAIKEVVASMIFHKAEKSMIVTAGSFTKRAIDLAIYNDVDLWDGKKLLNVVQQLNQQICNEKKNMKVDQYD